VSTQADYASFCICFSHNCVRFLGNTQSIAVVICLVLQKNPLQIRTTILRRQALTGGGISVLSFYHSREKSSSENFSRSARLAQTAKQFASSRRGGARRAKPAAKRAFCHGIVKN
jgi:hypothetical protein